MGFEQEGDRGRGAMGALLGKRMVATSKKPISTRKLAANRANALKSTGPRMDSG
jgi:hypothetical protein